MNEAEPTTCRDLTELEDRDCCEPCHRTTASGHDRLNLIELDHGRMAWRCHAAFDALR